MMMVSKGLSPKYSDINYDQLNVTGQFGHPQMMILISPVEFDSSDTAREKPHLRRTAPPSPPPRPLLRTSPLNRRWDGVRRTRGTRAGTRAEQRIYKVWGCVAIKMEQKWQICMDSNSAPHEKKHVTQRHCLMA